MGFQYSGDRGLGGLSSKGFRVLSSFGFMRGVEFYSF